MRAASRIAFAAILLFAMSSSGIAQMGMRGPDLSGVWNPVVGAGGSYETQSADGKRVHHMDMFIVGKETVAGKDAYWFETVVEGGPRGVIIMKMLTVVDGSNYQYSRKIIQFPGQPPMEMAADSPMARQGSSSRMSDIRTDGQNMGSDTVTVPAGSFVCDHWHSSNGDTWISPKAPPFGLVKTVSKDGSTMVLVKVLSDVKDRIVGTPVPFDPAQMMQQGRPPQQ